jgi:hypothetical protein
MSKRESIAANMRTAAGCFRSTAAEPLCPPKEGEILLKVAADYLMCAKYIEDLEDQLSRFELQAIRNQGRAA